MREDAFAHNKMTKNIETDLLFKKEIALRECPRHPEGNMFLNVWNP